MLRSVNPATGEEIATYPELTPEEIEAKVARAAATFATWRATPLDERTALLARIADQYDANKDRLARMATAEMGKTLKSAIAEVEKCAAAFRFYRGRQDGWIDRWPPSRELEKSWPLAIEISLTIAGEPGRPAGTLRKLVALPVQP